jgi:hypothetical protein
MGVGVFCFLGKLRAPVATKLTPQASSTPFSLLVKESKLPEPDVSAPQLTADLSSPKSLGGYWKYTLVSMLQALNLPVSCLERCSALELRSDIVHPFLGPLLIITYALLSNTLLLTVLVAILGNTFATINADAAAEVSCILLASRDQAE